MKKFIGLMLLLVLLTGLIPSAVTVHGAMPNMLYSNDFEASSDWSGGTHVTTPDGTISIGKHLSVTNETASYMLPNTIAFPNSKTDRANERAFLEYDAMVTSTAANASFILTSDDGTKHVAQVEFATDNKIKIKVNGTPSLSADKEILSNGYIIMGDYLPDVWYRIRVEVLVTNGNGNASKRMNFFVNGRQINSDEGTDQSHPPQIASGSPSNIGRIQVVSAGAVAKIDNVTFHFGSTSEKGPNIPEGDKPLNRGALITALRNARQAIDSPSNSGKDSMELSGLIAEGIALYESTSAAQSEIGVKAEEIASATIAFISQGEPPSISDIDPIADIVMDLGESDVVKAISGGIHNDGVTQTIFTVTQNSNSAVADVAVAGRSLTVSAKAVGATDIEVTGTAGELSKKISFSIMVNEPLPTSGEMYAEGFPSAGLPVGDMAWGASNTNDLVMGLDSNTVGINNYIKVQSATSARSIQHDTLKLDIAQGIASQKIYYEFDAMVSGVKNSGEGKFAEYPLKRDNEGQGTGAVTAVQFTSEGKIQLRTMGVGAQDAAKFGNYTDRLGASFPVLVLKDSYEENRWYRFGLEIFVTGSDANLVRTLNVYIDGTKANADGAVTSLPQLANNYTNINRVMVRIDLNGTGGFAAIDNIRLYLKGNSTPEPIFKDALIGRIREAQRKLAAAVVGDRDGQYTLAAKNSLSDVVLSVVPVYSSASSTQADIDTAAEKLRKALAAFKPIGAVPIELSVSFYKSNGTEPLTSPAQDARVVTKLQITTDDTAEPFRGSLIVAAVSVSDVGTALEMHRLKKISAVLPVGQTNVTSDSTVVITNTLDLSEFTQEERAEMTLKAFVWDDLIGMRKLPHGGNENAEQPDVNISQSILPDGQPFITIAGEYAADRWVTMELLKKDGTAAELENESLVNQVLAHIQEGKTDSKGKFIFNYGITGNDNEYTLRIKFEGNAAPIERAIVYDPNYDPVPEILHDFNTLTAEQLSEHFDISAASNSVGWLGLLDTPQREHRYALYQSAFFTDAERIQICNGLTSERPQGGFSGLSQISDAFNMLIFEKELTKASLWQGINKIMNDNSDVIPTAYGTISSGNIGYVDQYIFNNRSRVSAIGISGLVDEAIASIPQDSTPSSSGGGGGGGGFAGAVITPEAPKEATGSEAKTPMERVGEHFSDLSDVEWASQAINILFVRGVIKGKAEGVFSPNDNITREEFVKIAVLALDFMDYDAICTFDDVGEDDWFYGYIASGQEIGVINGNGGGVFGVGQQITRQDAVTLAYRFAVAADAGFPANPPEPDFVDWEQISDYAREAVKHLSVMGIVSGVGEDTFAPQAFCTRAQAAKIIYEITNTVVR